MKESIFNLKITNYEFEKLSEALEFADNYIEAHGGHENGLFGDFFLDACVSGGKTFVYKTDGACGKDKENNVDYWTENIFITMKIKENTAILTDELPKEEDLIGDKVIITVERIEETEC